MITFLKGIGNAAARLWTDIKTHTHWLVAVLIIGCLLIMGEKFGKWEASKTVASLTEQLAESEKTVELKQGLYATTLVQVGNLNSLLEGNSTQIEALKKQLSDSQAQLLTTQQLTIQWKQAYQGALAATQTNGGGTVVPTGGTTPVVVPVGRTRVDFTGGLGPIAATGYTLTNPAAAYLTLNQTRPLQLTVSVAKEKDGTWTSYVTSSDPDVNVNVALGGVDPGVLAPLWYQRIWVEGGVDFLSEKRVSLGARYQFDRWSVGAGCSLEAGLSAGCGLTAGFRLFQ